MLKIKLIFIYLFLYLCIELSNGKIVGGKSGTGVAKGVLNNDGKPRNISLNY